MSVSVVASSDGNSAIIKLNGVERLKVNSDGSLVVSSSPAAGVRGNVLATMQAFNSEFACLLEENGYQVLPNGLIFQWGTVSLTAGVTLQALLPTAFPVKLLCPQATGSDVPGAEAEVAVMAFTKSTISLRSDVTQTAYWFAVGR